MPGRQRHVEGGGQVQRSKEEQRPPHANPESPTQHQVTISINSQISDIPIGENLTLAGSFNVGGFVAYFLAPIPIGSLASYLLRAVPRLYLEFRQSRG